MSRKQHGPGRAGGSGKAVVWDTGSSLYDSYELAAVRRLLDRRLLAAAGAGGGVLPLHGEPPSAAEARRGKKSEQTVAVVVGARRKVTLRAIFRAVATWAARPRQAPVPCACAGMVHDHGQAAAAVVEPDVPSHGHL